MALTEAQRTTLAGHIRANTDQAVIDALSGGNHTEIARLYNLESSFWAWRSSIAPEEYRKAITWTEVDTLTAGSARIWEWVTGGMTLVLDASDANVRQGIADVFAANTNTRSDLLDLAKRLATLAESLFATGTGTNGNPGVLVFEGNISTDDVGRALNDNPA